jgi:hypothetical protein
MKFIRAWATPLTIGAFVVMSVTGILMFFHFNTRLNKLVHEWAGWAMVLGVAAHVAVNWTPFARYLSSGLISRSLVALGIVTLAASFAPPPQQARGGSAAGMAVRAIVEAPISNVAPLTGKSLERIMEDLAKAGVALPDARASIRSVIGKDRELQAKAIGALFRKAK